MSSQESPGNALKQMQRRLDELTARIVELEAQLSAGEERLRLVAENSPNPLMIWDKAGALRYVSPAVTADLGFSPQALHHDNALLQPLAFQSDMPEFTSELLEKQGARNSRNPRSWYFTLRAVHHCLQHPGEKIRIQGTVETKFGVRELEGVLQGFRRSDGGCEVVGIAHDITEHRQLEQMLTDANAELEERVAKRTAEVQAKVVELQRANAGKDAFFAAVSHELRTPLTGILSMSEQLALQERGTLTPEQLQYVEIIRGSGERLLEAVNSIIDYTKAIGGAVILEFGLCPLAEISAAAVRSVRKSVDRKHQRLTCTVEPADLAIKSDYHSITQILKVMLNNASKFTPEQGVIELTVTAVPDTDAVGMTVADNGIGMSEEELAGIFRPFSQGDLTLARRFNGLGLGLAYMYKLVELLGGSVSAASQPGQGSRFTVILPRHKPADKSD